MQAQRIASFHPRHDTHIEFVTYGRGGDVMSALFLPMTGDGTRLTRPLMLVGNILRHPLQFLRMRWPFGFARRTLLFLVMQSLDNAISFRAKRRWFGRGVRLTTEQDPAQPNPTFIEAGYQAAKWLAEHTGGVAQGVVLESLANIPPTAHILGGVVIGRDISTGVVDRHNRVFGYQNLLVCDGGRRAGQSRREPRADNHRHNGKRNESYPARLSGARVKMARPADSAAGRSRLNHRPTAVATGRRDKTAGKVRIPPVAADHSAQD